jgi:hypothetical protein
MFKTMTGAALIAALSLAGACSDDGGGDGAVAGVDRAKPTSSLTNDERTALCNWVAPQLGGYGAAAKCELIPLSAPADLADCFDGFPDCDVPVGTVADCYSKIIEAVNACTQAAYDSARTSTVCLTSASCF